MKPPPEQFGKHLAELYWHANPRPLNDVYLKQLFQTLIELYIKGFTSTSGATYKVFLETCIDALSSLTRAMDPRYRAPTSQTVLTVKLQPVRELDVNRKKTEARDWHEFAPTIEDALRAFAKVFQSRKDALTPALDWSLKNVGHWALEPIRASDWENHSRTTINELKKQDQEGREEFYRLHAQWDWIFLNTPLYPYAERFVPPPIDAPFEIPERARFEHHWIVAPPGTGKTNAIQCLIEQDLLRVARGEATIVLIDSQNEIVPNLAKLDIFAPGGPLHGKLVYLEPDPEYPLALNIFDMDHHRLSSLSVRDREQLVRASMDLIDFFLTAIFKTDLSGHQDVMLKYLVPAAMAVPDATLFTVKDLLEKGGYERYKDRFVHLDKEIHDWLQTRLDAPEYKPTIGAVKTRLDGLAADPLFRKMFRHPRNRLDFLGEINAGKVILINTNKGLLKEDGTELFGRFFIAKLLQATEERALLKGPQLPVFCYIDECHDYIKNEPRIATLIDRARKRNVAMIFAHQRLKNIESPNVLDALANVAIRMAARNETDAETLARSLHTAHEEITDKPRGTFVTYVRGVTTKAEAIKFPLMTQRPQMTDREYAQIMQDMRGRYCAPVEAPLKPQTVSPTPAKAKKTTEPTERPDVDVVRPTKNY